MACRLSAGRSIVVAALLPIAAIILYQAVGSSWYASRTLLPHILSDSKSHRLSRDGRQNLTFSLRQMELFALAEILPMLLISRGN
jgi:hypothetical protein